MPAANGEKRVDFSKTWTALRQADDTFFQKRIEFFALSRSEQIQDLHLALTGDRHSVELALRLLRVLPPDMGECVADDLLEIAIDGAEVLAPEALDVIVELASIPKPQIVAFVGMYLSKSNPDSYLYSRIAQLYYRLGYASDLRDFLNAHCLISDNPDIRELMTEYADL